MERLKTTLHVLRNYIRFIRKYSKFNPTKSSLGGGYECGFIYRGRCYMARLTSGWGPGTCYNPLLGGVVNTEMSYAHFEVFRVDLCCDDFTLYYPDAVYERKFYQDHYISKETLFQDIYNFKHKKTVHIILTKGFPPAPYAAINLFTVLFVREAYARRIQGTAEEGNFIRHEYTHTLQQREMWFLPFYVWYGIEYVIKYVVCLMKGYKVYNNSVQRTAYRSISFEQEAYINQQNKVYNNKRKHWGWFRYVTKLYHPTN